jgi:hypothetical protein
VVNLSEAVAPQQFRCESAATATMGIPRPARSSYPEITDFIEMRLLS